VARTIAGPLSSIVGSVTWFSTPCNAAAPTHLHLREADAGFPLLYCPRRPYTLKKVPVSVRYGLHVHAWAIDPKFAATRVASFFRHAVPWRLVKAELPWRLALPRQGPKGSRAPRTY